MGQSESRRSPRHDGTRSNHQTTSFPHPKRRPRDLPRSPEIKRSALRERIRESMTDLRTIERPKISAGIEDFAAAARNVKLYSEQEKSQEVVDAVYVMKPKVSREDLGGLHDVKNKVLNHIALAFNPSMRELGHQSNPRFFLLGPPGT